ncbi:MAG TPA: sugar ABC transporter permease [Thermomicrobiales bacterium]|nr:sugar ABC transporter permease [Thermomicrobiales bacterium]
MARVSTPAGDSVTGVPADRLPAEKAPKRRMGALARREMWAGYLFLLPNMIGFLIFTALAVVASAGISLTSWDLLSDPEFVGLDNYVRLFTNDPLFRTVLWNTFYFTIVSVPGSTIIALALALVLNSGLRGIPLFRTAYFLPVITATVVVALIWRWFYNPDFGILNYLLWEMGVEQPPNWLSSRTWAMPAVIILSIWKQVGYSMVIFLAGLQAIPAQLYEAASIDGAGPWQRFKGITLPLLTPTTFFVLVISFIGSLQVFDAVLVLTDGGPANSTRTMVYHIWEEAFVFLRMGYAAAVAWVLFFIVFLITLIQWKLQKRWVHYEY